MFFTDGISKILNKTNSSTNYTIKTKIKLNSRSSSSSSFFRELIISETCDLGFPTVDASPVTLLSAQMCQKIHGGLDRSINFNLFVSFNINSGNVWYREFIFSR